MLVSVPVGQPAKPAEGGFGDLFCRHMPDLPLVHIGAAKKVDAALPAEKNDCRTLKNKVETIT
jgi:hypothetical protein